MTRRELAGMEFGNPVNNVLLREFAVGRKNDITSVFGTAVQDYLLRIRNLKPFVAGLMPVDQ